MAVLGMPEGSIGVIGGAEVFGLFLDRYDVFYLCARRLCACRVGDRYFPKYRRELQKKYSHATGLNPVRSGSLTQKKLSRLLNGIVPQKLNRIDCRRDVYRSDT